MTEPSSFAITASAWPLTLAFAAFHVGLQLPALVTRAFHAELVLLAALAALQMFGAEALDLTGLVVRPQLHAQRTGADDALAGSHGAVMAAVAVVHRAQICETESTRPGRRGSDADPELAAL